MALLFVYGTLRRGESASHLLAEATFAGTATIAANAIIHQGYRALTPGNGTVDGEVFEVPERLFLTLDRYEGPEYERKLSSVTRDGEMIEAWAYWLRG